QPGYYSTLVTRADTGITKISDIKGKEASLSIAYADPTSTSGFLAPSKMLLDAGIDLATLNKNQLFAGGHDKAILADFQGKTKLNGTNEGALLSACQAGLVNRVRDLVGGENTVNCQKQGASADGKDDLVIIAKYKLPGSPISYRTTMDPNLS